jgi:hypothetical protein
MYSVNPATVLAVTPEIIVNWRRFTGQRYFSVTSSVKKALTNTNGY